MLWTICVILLVLWLLGMVTSYTAGGLIHILLVVGLVIVVINVIQGRRAISTGSELLLSVLGVTRKCL